MRLSEVTVLAFISLTAMQALGANVMPPSAAMKPAGAPPAVTKTAALPVNPAAAKKAAESDPACTSIQPFYWEIGSKDAQVVSGATGDGSITRATAYGIASASKWVFGAYVIEKANGKIDATMSKFLHMASGYNSMPAAACVFQPTVGACVAKGENGKFTPETENHFYYNGGHFEKWAADHGLAGFGRQELAEEYKKVLGKEIPFEFGFVQPAGGMRMSAETYAMFLQKILRGQLKIHDHLGENPICTLPSSCPGQAIRSPVRSAWHYSYAHWIEDAPDNGDGAFSSPGAFGFYPWIDASKTYYGVISRRKVGRDPGEQMGAGYASAMCGQKIRRAFFSK